MLCRETLCQVGHKQKETDISIDLFFIQGWQSRACALLGMAVYLGAGQARMAMAAMASSLSRSAWSLACVDIPCITVQ